MSRVTPNSRSITNGKFRGALVLAAALLSSDLPAAAEAGGEAQDRMASLKQSVAANQQRLHQYARTETTQLNLNGDPKPPSQTVCRYGPDGQVQKTQICAPPPPPSGGRFKQRIVAKKTGEMQDYMGQVKTLLALYVPPNAQHMQEAFGGGNVSINPSPGSGTTNIVFKNYAQPGDQRTITFDTAAKKISTINVNTYMDDPKDVVTLAIQFASLSDSTNYVQQSVLNATAKKLFVTTTNSHYHSSAHMVKAKLNETLIRKEVCRFLYRASDFGNLGHFIGAGFTNAVLGFEEEENVALSSGPLLNKCAVSMGMKLESLIEKGSSYPAIASMVCPAPFVPVEKRQTEQMKAPSIVGQSSKWVHCSSKCTRQCC